jgi:hypothetical protein
MFTFCRKLKILKRPLKELNKLHYSHISERVARAESDLDRHQSLLCQGRDNVQLLLQDKKLRLKLMNLKSAEKMFFGQKLNSIFLKDADIGTRDLLGTLKLTFPIIKSVIHYGPCLNVASHASLLALVTDDDIKHALFSIGNEKALGLDSYSFFFQESLEHREKRFLCC